MRGLGRDTLGLMGILLRDVAPLMTVWLSCAHRFCQAYLTCWVVVKIKNEMSWLLPKHTHYSFLWWLLTFDIYFNLWEGHYSNPRDPSFHRELTNNSLNYSCCQWPIDQAATQYAKMPATRRIETKREIRGFSFFLWPQLPNISADESCWRWLCHWFHDNKFKGLSQQW